MVGNIVGILVGIACIIMGIINMTGNISTLHSYHRNRVSEEDRIPFGRMVGLGTIIMGAGITIFGTLMTIADCTGAEVLVIIGTAVMIAAIAAGAAITFLAMKKYNGGIF